MMKRRKMKMKTLEELREYKFQTEVMLEVCLEPSSQAALRDRLDAINAEIAEMEKEENA
jgi:hypothetical protein